MNQYRIEVPQAPSPDLNTISFSSQVMTTEPPTSSALARIGLLASTNQGRGWSQRASRLINGAILVGLLVLPSGAAEAPGGGAPQATDTTDILAGLRPEHPRLIFTAADWTSLRAARGGTNTVAQILAVLETKARAVLKQPPVTYKKEGRRLLAVSREAMRRIVLCGFTYRLTGDRVFLDRAENEMLTVAAFADWNPSHFLDTAEMTAGLALGYDWLFAELSPATRATVREAMIEKGLKLGIALKGKGWQRATMNWNQVCFGGLALGALAIADEAPAVAAALLQQAHDNNHYGLEPYAPDGVYPEGPSYYNYGTSYQVLLLSALESALGTDWNLAAAPGFMASAAAQMQLAGPGGQPFNFSDGSQGQPMYQPWLFWFAQRLNQPALVYFQQQCLQEVLADRLADSDDRAWPLVAKWVATLPPTLPAPTLPLAWQGRGHNPVGVFRTSWTDPNALYLAFKAGAANNNHGHMDAGSFVLDAQGVRWGWDLGKQDYNSIEAKGWALFDPKQDSDRWRVYRLNNFSHSTLTLGGQLHNAGGRAAITAFDPHTATVDLSAVFTPQAKAVFRHFDFQPDRIRIRDEIQGATNGLSVRWQMLTRAAITLNGDAAALRQDGKIMQARILSPAGARFETASAQPPDDGVNQPNPDFNLLQVNVSVPASGNQSLAIELRPESVSDAK